MTREELVRVILSDLRGKMDYKLHQLYAYGNQMKTLTAELKDTILAIQKLLIVHTRAYETLYHLLCIAHKNNIIIEKSDDNVANIIRKIEMMEKNALLCREVEIFNEQIADLELTIYTVEEPGLVKVL